MPTRYIVDLPTRRFRVDRIVAMHGGHKYHGEEAYLLIVDDPQDLEAETWYRFKISTNGRVTIRKPRSRLNGPVGQGTEQ